MATRANGVVIDQGDWNQMVANFSHLGGTLGDTKTGNYVITGELYVVTPPFTVGPSASATGMLRTGNGSTGAIGWRNGGGTADLLLYPDSSNRLVLGGSGVWLTQTTVGAAGGASALPATPTTYLVVTVNGASLRIPLYA